MSRSMIGDVGANLMVNLWNRSPQIKLERSCRKLANLTNPLLRSRSNLILGRHVKEALANGSPIVALESTVITHGLPEPDNLELALRLEQEIASWHPSKGTMISCVSNTSELSPQELVDWDQNHNDAPPSGFISSRAEEQYARSNTNSNSLVVPATIGIVKGQVIVGLSRDEIEYLATKRLSTPIKASRRDLPIAMARGLSAGTTVAATMAIAASLRLQGSTMSNHSMAECLTNGFNQSASNSPIKVFATGGTGGVHVGGESSMDISADLYEFARTPMGVVSSGFKSFLDARRSLEFLETMGCTVMSLSRASDEEARRLKAPGVSEMSSSSPHSSKHKINLDSPSTDSQLFPAFFSAINRDGVKSPCIVESISEAARILLHCLEATPLSEKRGALLAIPIPSQFSLDELEDDTLAKAMTSIRSIDKRKDLKGFEKTPLILEQLNRETGGKTLKANVELLKNNARVGAHLAYEYNLMREKMGAILPRGEDQDLDYNFKGRELFSDGPGEKIGKHDCDTKADVGRSGSTLATKRELKFVGKPTERRKQWKLEGDEGSRGATGTTGMVSSMGRDRLSHKEDRKPVLGERHELDHCERLDSAGTGACYESGARRSNDIADGGRGESETSTCQGPVLVVGCTMIDMHVSTKIDDHFKVSLLHLWPAGMLVRAKVGLS